MVTLLMISMTAPNQLCASVGLNRTRSASSTRDRRARTRAFHEFGNFALHDLLDVAAARESLAHPRSVNVELQAGLASRKYVSLKIGRDVESERIAPGIQPLVHFVPVPRSKGA